MQRFLLVGQARLNVVDAVAHDPSAWPRVQAVLDQLRPTVVLAGLSPAAWDLLAEPGSLDPWEARVFERVADLVPGAQPQAVFHRLRAWAQSNGAAVRLVPGALPDPPLRRRDLKALDKMVRKEGFVARDARSAVERLHLHYASRVPELSAWLDARRSAMAAGLAAHGARHQEDLVAVFPYPEGDRVAELLQARARANP